MTNEKETQSFKDKVYTWLAPLLMAIVTFFLIQVFKDMRDLQDNQIMLMREQTFIKNELNHIDNNMERIERNFERHIEKKEH